MITCDILSELESYTCMYLKETNQHARLSLFTTATMYVHTQIDLHNPYNYFFIEQKHCVCTLFIVCVQYSITYTGPVTIRGAGETPVRGGNIATTTSNAGDKP